MGDLEPRDAGGDVFASHPRGRYAQGSGCALQRRWGQCIIRRLTRLSNGSGTPSINSNDSEGLHLAARARHAGVSYARHEQESQSARVLQWFAARPPSDEHFHSFRTLTDEFAFRRISRIDVRVLPIQIEHHWQDIAASTPPLPCADYLAVTKAQD